MGFLILVVLGAIGYFLAGFFIVQQQTAALVERFGRFKRIARPGLNWRFFIVDRIVGRPSLRVQQLDVRVETKTSDDVFVNVIVSVQFFVINTKIIDAFYRLQQPEAQIRSYVYDVVRAQVPTIKLDDVFETKDEIAKAVRLELSQVMDDFGYGILKTLVTDIDPDAKVKASMNQINAAQRLRLAAIEEAEAEKIRVVKAAEGDATSKALQGKGIADQRLAIINGLEESIGAFKSNIDGTSTRDVMMLVLMTQYFDTLKDIGASAKSNSILIPHSPGGMNDLADQIRNSMITANELDQGRQSPPDTLNK